MSEQVALYFHLLGAFLFVSGCVAISILRFSAIHSQDTAEIVTLLNTAKKVVPVVVVGYVITVAFGLWLAKIEGYWDRPWLQICIVLTGAMLLIGGLAGREDRKTREMASTAILGGSVRPDDKLQDRLQDSMVCGMNGSMLVGIFVVITLMIFKP